MVQYQRWGLYQFLEEVVCSDIFVNDLLGEEGLQPPVRDDSHLPPAIRDYLAMSAPYLPIMGY